jgi:DNA-binding transcriptional ArsR family regulator
VQVTKGFPPAPDACAVPGADAARVARGRAHLLDEASYAEIADTFRALADSSRAKIVYSLLREELCTCDLAAILGHSESSVSQHLRVLRQLRLVKNRREGKMVFALSHARDADQAHAGMERVLDLFAEAR